MSLRITHLLGLRLQTPRGRPHSFVTTLADFIALGIVGLRCCSTEHLSPPRIGEDADGRGEKHSEEC